MRWRLAAPVGVAALLAAGGAAAAAGTIVFDKAPGTGAPPARVDSVPMNKFPADKRKLGSKVTTVKGPRGAIKFSRTALLDLIKNVKTGPYWQTWSHGYHGNVYFVQGPVTITLPSHTVAFYLYAEPDSKTTNQITATSGRVTSGPITVRGSGGAKFFGFVARGGVFLRTVHLSSSDRRGFAVGEFGIHRKV